MADPRDHEIAAELATRAGNVLVDLRAKLAGSTDAKELKAEGDRRSHEMLVSALAALCPNDAVLSEEGRDNPARLAAPRVWVVDPLDGTREFGEPPRHDWAVHVALVEGGVPTAGAVALPALGITYRTDQPVTLPPAPDRLRVVVSRTRPPAEALAIAEALGAELVEMGSAGAKTMAILRGEVDVYPHSGGQYEWDSAAPVAVAASAGLHVSRLDGAPLEYNRSDPYLPDLLVCRPEHAAAVLDAVG